MDAHSDEVMDAVERFAADIALGPALAINAHEMAIKLQFDVIAATTAELHQRLSTLLAIVERETALPIDSLTTTAEFSEAESAPG